MLLLNDVTSISVIHCRFATHILVQLAHKSAPPSCVACPLPGLIQLIFRLGLLQLGRSVPHFITWYSTLKGCPTLHYMVTSETTRMGDLEGLDQAWYCHDLLFLYQEGTQSMRILCCKFCLQALTSLYYRVKFTQLIFVYARLQTILK